MELSTRDRAVSALPVVSDIVGDTLACNGSIVTYSVAPKEGVAFNWNVSINSKTDGDNSKKGQLK